MFARAQIKREQDRSDRLEAQLTEQAKAHREELGERDKWHQERTIPALVEVTRLMQDLRNDMARERNR